MATEHVREKMNQLANLILNEDVQCEIQQLQIEAAKLRTGDGGVDQQLTVAAENAKAAILGASARLRVYRARFAELDAEQKASQSAAEAAENAKNEAAANTAAA